jgi:hypothetical protein
MLSHSNHLPFLVSIGEVPAASYRGRRTDAAEARQGVIYEPFTHTDATFGNVNSASDSQKTARIRASCDTIADLIALAEANISGRAK